VAIFRIKYIGERPRIKSQTDSWWPFRDHSALLALQGGEVCTGSPLSILVGDGPTTLGSRQTNRNARVDRGEKAVQYSRTTEYPLVAGKMEVHFTSLTDDSGPAT
jgi:hypothetical protein